MTLASGQLVTPTAADLDLSNGTNYLRKELKKDIHIPSNADINTLESYLENGHLVIKCMLKKETSLASGGASGENGGMDEASAATAAAVLAAATATAAAAARRSSPVYSSTPVYSKTTKSSSSTKPSSTAAGTTANILSEFEMNKNNHSDQSKDLSPLEITINSRTSVDSNDVSSNFIFENPLYNNSTIQATTAVTTTMAQLNEQQPSTGIGKSILKNAGNSTAAPISHETNILIDYTTADMDNTDTNYASTTTGGMIPMMMMMGQPPPAPPSSLHETAMVGTPAATMTTTTNVVSSSGRCKSKRSKESSSSAKRRGESLTHNNNHNYHNHHQGVNASPYYTPKDVSAPLNTAPIATSRSRDKLKNRSGFIYNNYY